MTASTKSNHAQSHGRQFRLLSTVSMSLAIALAAQHAAAQEAGSDAGFELSEIVVTAQKREETLQKVPISIAVLGGKALDKQVSGGTLDALLSVPGISMSTSDAGGMTQVSVRGVSAAVPFGGGSGTVGYYVDSIPFGLVRSAAVPNTNAYDMARVEVLRGPQGTLYGASALNGVVRILTNDADTSKFEAKARGSVSTTKGGEASFRADAAINIPLIEDKLAIRIIGGVESQGGWIDQPVLGKKDANDDLSRTLRVKLAATPSDDLRIDLSAWFSYDRYGAASYADSKGLQFTPLAQPGKTKYQAYNAKITYDLPFMSITSATSYLNFRQKIYTDFSYAAPALPPQLLQLYSDLPAEVTTEELLFNSTGTGPWRWSAGVFYRDAHDDRYQTLPAVLAGKSISWSDRTKSYAVFGQITRTFFDDKFEISGGLRYFHDKLDTVTLTPPDSLLGPGTARVKVHAVTPRIVATWLPNPHTTVYVSYSQGFRSGLNQTPLTLLAAPLPAAKSDKLNNYEIGSKGTILGGFLSYDVSGYYIKWNDIQQAGSLQYGNPPAYISATINGVSASGFGSDLNVTLHPVKGLDIGGTVSYNNLKQDKDVTQFFANPDFGVVPNAPNVVLATLNPEGSRLSFSPSTTMSAYVSYAFPLSAGLDGRFNASVDYRSRQILRALGTGAQTTLCSSTRAVTSPTTTNPITNGYCESGSPVFVNGSFELSDHSGKTFSIFVRNLTNWKGLTDPAYSITTAFRPRPRTIGMQFEAKF